MAGERVLELVQTLEQEIVTGVLAPGDRLDEASLASRFGVSRTPVREALNQLRDPVRIPVRRGEHVDQSSPAAQAIAAEGLPGEGSRLEAGQGAAGSPRVLGLVRGERFQRAAERERQAGSQGEPAAEAARPSPRGCHRVVLDRSGGSCTGAQLQFR